MPNLAYHLALAWESAQCFPDPLLRRHQGPFLLGATAPDIRAMTRAKRDETHFAPLSSQEITAGIKGLFRAHPSLRQATTLPEPTRAFMLGYFSHLIADMAWVVLIFRPFFANPHLFPEQAEGLVLDRALQLNLDQSSLPLVQTLVPLLDKSEAEVEVGFLQRDDLAHWRAIVQEMCTRTFSWERLRNYTRRLFPDGNPFAQRLAEGFIHDPATWLAYLSAHVAPQEIARFAQECQCAWLQVAKEWLACVS